MEDLFGLRILTGKKHPKLNSSAYTQIRILKFGLLVHQINFFQEVLVELGQILQKN